MSTSTGVNYDLWGVNRERTHFPSVQLWLWIGVVMIFVQIVVGGITRLTGSGLSITKWEIVTGTLPPLNAADWQTEFEAYKATPQYQKINDGMSLSAFKFIYFWEYFHRLWARSLGFVFLIPFLLFLYRKRLDAELIKKVLLAVLFGGVVGLFGWIMVASGLVDRPWVNAYKLMLHLGLAVLLMSYMIYVTVWYARRRSATWWTTSISKRTLWQFTVLLFIQILLGALMSGMKAGLFFPTWPSMNGSYWPEVLRVAENWGMHSFVDYDRNAFMPALVQIFHRSFAYIIFIALGITAYKRADRNVRILFGIICIQVVLGIWTVISCVGQIPVGLGVMHQFVGVISLGYLIAMLTTKYSR